MMGPVSDATLVQVPVGSTRQVRLLSPKSCLNRGFVARALVAHGH